MSKVLVTSADGFIGSPLTELLVEKGLEACAFAFFRDHLERYKVDLYNL